MDEQILCSTIVEEIKKSHLAQPFALTKQCSADGQKYKNTMQSLGNFEETILLIIMAMDNDAYGFSVTEAYEEHTGKSISISAVHAVMSRLENKGLIESHMGGASADRGGRRKRIFQATGQGLAVISEIKASRQKLWELIPEIGN